jgi:uncharacterized membrane protein SirB2
MNAWYLQIRWLHIAAVVASGSLFALRGVMMLADPRNANHRALRIASIVIDTILLGAALLLVAIIHQYPFVHAWLTVKVVLLCVYIVLGHWALKRGRTRARRAVCYVAALAVYLFIVSVARLHDPLGVLAPWLR